MPSSTTPFANLTQEVEYIIQGAQKRSLDPAAVLAVAQSEGLGSGPGDNNTSFGPFQLHIGGRYPTSPATAPQGNPTAQQDWANSPAGIDYALNAIAGVAAGTTGQQAITNIVTYFEHPADIPGEISRANGTYSQWQGAVSSGVIPGTASSSGGGLLGGVISGIGQALDPQSLDKGLGLPTSNAGNQVLGSLGKSLGLPTTSQLTGLALRGLQMVAGAFMVAVGLYLLARQVGLAPAPVPGVAAAAGVLG